MEEEVRKSRSNEEYLTNFEEFLQEYRNSHYRIIDFYSYSISLGASLKYKLSEPLALKIQYIFRYYDSILYAN